MHPVAQQHHDDAPLQVAPDAGPREPQVTEAAITEMAAHGGHPLPPVPTETQRTALPRAEGLLQQGARQEIGTPFEHVEHRPAETRHGARRTEEPGMPRHATKGPAVLVVRLAMDDVPPPVATLGRCTSGLQLEPLSCRPRHGEEEFLGEAQWVGHLRGQQFF